jgi:hypothetical protein
MLFFIAIVKKKEGSEKFPRNYIGVWGGEVYNITKIVLYNIIHFKCAARIFAYIKGNYRA